jgi:cytochrome b561
MNEDVPAWPLSLRLAHWVSAALVIGTLGLGTYMVELVGDSAERFDLTQTHKSIGVTIFALTLMRLVLRTVTAAPKPEPAAPRLLLAARASHVSLYILLVLMPLAGWLMTTTTTVRVPTSVFGLFELPYPLAPDLSTYRLAHVVHVAAAIALAILIVLHGAAALVHALWWRDRTLMRMWRKPSHADARRDIGGADDAGVVR